MSKKCINYNTATECYNKEEHEPEKQKTTSAASFLTIPVELVYRILDNLDYFTILYSMRNVSQRHNAIVDSYPRYTTLTTLNLQDNGLGHLGAQYLADALRNKTALTTLDFSSNNIGDEGAQHLGDALWNNTTLTTLNLASNKIGDEGAQQLATLLRTSTVTTVQS
ncbi:unnamed protein product [Adineta steineri]|uniref:F-box domain-containing protein n=1 Tax=Adineta steineri TaxID=433720 RepID=A0A814BP17_9BILA|nr:unnamed protein product [Adineta steineri]